MFNDNKIRVILEKTVEDYYYSIVDVVGSITNSKNPFSYWRNLKQRFNEYKAVNFCHSLKMPSNGCKMCLTYIASTDNLIDILNELELNKREELIQWLGQTILEKLYELNNTTNTLLYYSVELFLLRL